MWKDFDGSIQIQFIRTLQSLNIDPEGDVIIIHLRIRNIIGISKYLKLTRKKSTPTCAYLYTDRSSIKCRSSGAHSSNRKMRVCQADDFVQRRMQYLTSPELFTNNHICFGFNIVKILNYNPAQYSKAGSP